MPEHELTKGDCFSIRINPDDGYARTAESRYAEIKIDSIGMLDVPALLNPLLLAQLAKCIGVGHADVSAMRYRAVKTRIHAISARGRSDVVFCAADTQVSA